MGGKPAHKAGASGMAAELMDEEIEGAAEDWETERYTCVVCPNCQYVYHLTIGRNRVAGQTVRIPYRCPDCLCTGGLFIMGK